MPYRKNLVATLITNPDNPILTSDYVDKACKQINASHVYWLCDGVACDIPLNNSINPQETDEKLRHFFSDEAVDIAIQIQDTRRKKLLIADMDSTIIQQECIDELAEEVGLRAEIAEITRRAMNGDIAFDVALKHRVSLLKDLSLNVIKNIIDNRITLMPGANTLLKTMRKNGAYTALVSGGFTVFTAHIAQQLGFDEHHANKLILNHEKLTGEVAEPILGKQAKLDQLLKICAQLSLSVKETMAVGDGANDLAMLQKAGSGVALHAKPMVAKAASIRIDYGDLTALLYLQGYRKSDFVH
ncbi:phosphoserine phosphatase SerB [Bartonella tamiae]|uniref:Phosphoserine phosphatase n=1 Tax=Bartonella tamiae Th239 TaxID=1094558 RepID=J1JVR1_9HYPH|nr:phosphoserine phosphatase SerB [Bartonella tamiae]EJF88645.1 phosphoserine phosphatase SerB [Bartonella tamiae Th239]EJF95105.1 phosphoserine phosphatase SerB [Bartonella tamiae Th307]